MRQSVLFFLPLSILAAATLAASSQDDAVLEAARRSQLEFRQGNLAVAEPLVKSLEQAVAKSPDNGQLWETLGHAYMSLQGSLYAGPLDIPRLIDTGTHARDAYARSLALKGDNALGRASHGMSQFVVSQLSGDAPGMQAGIDEMNAAVRQWPTSKAVRLTRGFTMIHLPPAMRDTNAVIDDLKFIMDVAPGGRQEDVLHVLLGDVYAEVGNLPSARKEYEQVTGGSAFAAEQVKMRFTDLAKGAIPADSIVTVRMGTGTRCSMCHAPGTDN
ncbi:MAG: hypothetical protein ABI821_17345 [Pseudomonadota bacterium]